MPIVFQCKSCQKRLKVQSTLAGKRIKCPCGQACSVPQAKSSSQAKATVASSQASESNLIDCQCGRKLRVPAAAAGKVVRCPCGVKTQLPLTPAPVLEAIPVQPPEAHGEPTTTQSGNAEDDWLADLPPVQPASFQPTQDNANFYQPVPREAETQTQRASKTAQPTNSTANRYLENAEQEIEREKLYAQQAVVSSGGMVSSGESSLNAGVFMGLIMMAGAAVWFIAGLAVGIIFFYPPFLFVFGLVSVVRGALGD